MWVTRCDCGSLTCNCISATSNEVTYKYLINDVAATPLPAEPKKRKRPRFEPPPVNDHLMSRTKRNRRHKL
jgi:hypothetical protein